MTIATDSTPAITPQLSTICTMTTTTVLTNNTALYQSALHSLPLQSRGKVRENYIVDDDKLLIITSDRLSAFDVVLSQPVPGKGKLLNQLSNFWFAQLAHIVPNHLTGIAPESVVAADERAQVEGRAVVVKRLQPILVEAVVRGYVAGGGWQEYQKSGAISGVVLPAGLRNAQKLPQPIFTPAAKAEQGQHDENISFDEMSRRIGADLAEKIRRCSLALYQAAADYALTRGIIIADTKFEFGLDAQGTLHLMDEVLTPDSSRFWPVCAYQVGQNPPSFDKQFARDWLAAQPWDKTPPAPLLPDEVIAKTVEKYREAVRCLTTASSVAIDEKKGLI